MSAPRSAALRGRISGPPERIRVSLAGLVRLLEGRSDNLVGGAPVLERNDIGSQRQNAPGPLSASSAVLRTCSCWHRGFEAVEVGEFLEMHRRVKGAGDTILPLMMPSCMKTPVSPLSPMPMNDVTPGFSMASPW